VAAALRQWRTRGSAHGDEDGRGGHVGAVLILALVYIVSISLIVAALATWAMNDLNNTTKFNAASRLHYAVTSTTDVAIQSIRYNPIPSNASVSLTSTYVSPLGECWVPSSGYVSQLPTPVDGDPVAVWCVTVENLASANTRVVTFYACLSASSTQPQVSAAAAACKASPYLTAVVAMDDYPQNATLQVQCNQGPGGCGQGTTLVSWTWGGSSSSGTAAVPASISWSAQPGPATVGNPDGGSVMVLDASNNPVVGDTVTVSLNSGPGTLDPASTLSVTTNSSGVAVFTNLILTAVGTYTLNATDGVVTSNSASFSVAAKPAQTVAFYNSTYTSTLTTGTAVYGSGTYQVYAKGSANGTITFASTTLGVCTVTSVTGVVTLVSSGACVLTADAAATSSYADSGTTNFTLTISNGSTATTVVSTTGSPSTPNQSVTYTATVTATSPSSGNPAGNVEFFDAGTAIAGCTAQALSASAPDTATCVVTYTTTGSHVITAQYQGSSGTYNASAVSSSITQVVSPATATYTGSSGGNLSATPTYYSINTSSTGSTTNTYDELTPGVAETITALTFTISTSSFSTYTATVGYVTPGGVWTAALSCTITGGSGTNTCSTSGSVSIPIGDSLNVLAVGSGSRTGTWVTTYTRP